jgi:peptide/nickel transport system substrate-binding protein
VTLTRPDATVVPEIGFWMPIVPEQVFGKQNVAKFPNNSGWVSAGPYRLTSVAKGQSYTFERVTPYPFAPNQTPTMQRVVFRVYPDINTDFRSTFRATTSRTSSTASPARCW